MVRLKEVVTLGGKVSEMFQFQYGTIKRFATYIKQRRVMQVSIPIWYD